MLVVDSNRRIKLPEIRQTPWFQKDLPPYLQTPAAAVDHAPSGSAESSPSLADPKELDASIEGGSQWADEELGYLRYEVLQDLCERVSVDIRVAIASIIGRTRDGQPVEKDPGMRIAYQLCRDHRPPSLEGQSMPNDPTKVCQ